MNQWSPDQVGCVWKWLIAMATSSSSAHLERVHYVQQSLRRVQLRWFVKRQDELGGRLTVHMSIIRHHGDDMTEWLCQRTDRENGDDFYDLPEHLLLPGHRYEINVKLTRQDDCCTEDDHFNGLRSVLDTRTISFRLGNYAVKWRHSNLWSRNDPHVYRAWCRTLRS